MKKTRILMIAAILAVTMNSTAFAQEAPQEVYDLATSKIAEIGKVPVIIQAVKEANARNKSLSSIKELDKQWKTKTGVADHMQALMDSPCGKYLREMKDVEPYIAEAFAMDKQGANVCMSDKTSDYWQGEKNIFVVPYNRGRGGIFVDAVQFDKGAQAKIAQVSVPVREGDKVIGAITIGIDIDRLNLFLKRTARNQN
jgi:hypothetical protein